MLVIQPCTEACSGKRNTVAEVMPQQIHCRLRDIYRLQLVESCGKVDAECVTREWAMGGNVNSVTPSLSLYIYVCRKHVWR